MPDYEYSDINLKDFEAALQVYLDELEGKWKSDRTAWQKFIQNLPFGIGYEDVDDAVDRIYDEIMRTVTAQGVSPYAASGLSPLTAQIYNSVVKQRAHYDWQKQHGKAVEDWQGEVVKAVGQDWQNKFTVQKWQASEEWRRYGAQVAEQGRETQRWQMKQQAQQGMWANERARQGALGEQWGAQAHRWGAMTQAMGQQGLGRDEKARIWESAKAEMLSAVGDEPMNWIKKWQVQHTQNPYAQPQTSVEQAWGDVETQREEAKRWKSAADDVRKRYKDPTDPLYMGTTGDWQGRNPEQEHARLILNAERVATEKLFEFEGTLAEEQESARGGIDWSEEFAESGGVPYTPSGPPRPRTAPTPDWLKKLYPTMGGRLPEKGKIGTEFAPAPLSGQWMSRAKPSELAGYMGYVKYAGGSPEDIMRQSQQMLPQPRQGSRWMPSRQWA